MIKKMKQKKIVIFQMLLIALFFATIATTVGPVIASDDGDDDYGKYSRKSVAGYWGFSAQGSVTTVSSIPAVAAGLVFFDGNGNCIFKIIPNVGGTTNPEVSDDCTYEVNDDGTGEWTVNFDLSPSATADFVIVNDGNELRYIIRGIVSGPMPPQEPALVAAGVAKRQAVDEHGDDD